jgi:hypothetical protein
MSSLFDIKIGDVLDRIPHDYRESGNIILPILSTNTLKLGYAIFRFPFPVTQHSCYYVFKYLDKDNPKQSKVIYLGEYRYLNHAVYWIRNDLFNNSGVYH